ncbi:MAG: hypothetical protein ACKVY0_00825 [Prosthecobacter sp.]|uniref:hypothetical protein n=1 Tax=Prosthecobacter sp. TaxID=1965333 RepID=UPI0038FDCFE3
MTGPIVLDQQVAGIAATILLLPPLVTWLVMRSKSKRHQAEAAAALAQQRAEAEATLQAEQAKATAQNAADKKASAEAGTRYADLEQRFATHREVADRRGNDASQQITRLESELAATRELAAQLLPTQSRIKDLETALAAEQGRVKAQDQAIEATNARAADMEKRLADAQDLLLKHKSEMIECEVELKKVHAEHAAYAAAGGIEGELVKAREANHQAEAKIVQLQRGLKAAEARVEMVQKEFMNAVGLASAPTPGAAASTASTDKKVRDLEEKLAQLETESRKRTREDGYKIAELEYRLSEALEAANKQAVVVKEEPKVEAPPPAPVVTEAPVTAVEVEPALVTEMPEPVIEVAPIVVAEEAPAVEAGPSTVVETLAPEIVSAPEVAVSPPATAKTVDDTVV